MLESKCKQHQIKNDTIFTPTYPIQLVTETHNQAHDKHTHQTAPTETKPNKKDEEEK